MDRNELERAGRDMLRLETLAEISSVKEEIAGYGAKFGSFEDLKVAAHAEGQEDFEKDDAYNAWAWAVDYLKTLEARLRELSPDVAA